MRRPPPCTTHIFSPPFAAAQRLFVLKSTDNGRTRSYSNVPTGTVVDADVVSNLGTPNFWLVPHHALQGTCRVPSYHVLANTAGWSIDQIEELTYDLCHIYFKCPRAVSIPAPVYYADLAATRGANLYNAAGEFVDLSPAASKRLFM